MKLLVVHPSCLMFSKIYLRLEPLGLELVAAAAREAGHSVRLIDLQCESHRNFFDLIRRWRPDVIAFSGNYLANVPEIIDLARATRALLPSAFISVGGHSVSFIPEEILRHTAGAVDCVLIGEGETAITSLLDALAKDRANLREVPGCVTLDHRGPPPTFVKSLDDLLPARDIVRHRRKYFIGQLDPAASIEFSRGCPWDCVFCSAWTFYGRNYRVKTPERAVEELAQVREPGIFIVDDVAFIQAEHGMQLGEAIARRGIRKRYYLETRRLTTRDYRLFDIQHAVLPTKLPLPEFYKELVECQRVLARKNLGWAALRQCAGVVIRKLLCGQTNFIRMLWKFNNVYRPELQLADHRRWVKYEISLPPPSVATAQHKRLYIHENRGRNGRQIDHRTEEFVNATRMGTAS